VKQRDIFVSGDRAGFIGYASQSIHYLGDIDAVGASNTAGVAGSAEPDAVCGQHLVAMSILDMAEELVGQDIHGKIQRASRRALLALKTILYFFSADLKNFRLQRYIFIGCLPA
jgi:hypothetical protein